MQTSAEEHALRLIPWPYSPGVSKVQNSVPLSSFVLPILRSVRQVQSTVLKSYNAKGHFDFSYLHLMMHSWVTVFEIGKKKKRVQLCAWNRPQAFFYFWPQITQLSKNSMKNASVLESLRVTAFLMAPVKHLRPLMEYKIPLQQFPWPDVYRFCPLPTCFKCGLSGRYSMSSCLYLESSENSETTYIGFTLLLKRN